MSQIRRRQLLVDVKLQGTLLAHVTLYWLYCLLSVVFFAFIWIVFSKRPRRRPTCFNSYGTISGRF